ncbi:uncharacterized protein C8A04DRAFT_11496 [Dichotomopilus funicola]|uniref:Uncharacterized protein n=1 Tax=Dichotomopilus funicola TaxID=1934379 RepID=A0AAN6V3V4_9PEZI|nr:hypothetical protein C8A04DRAFT_11496 [Dichotomopilus funicola]
MRTPTLAIPAAAWLLLLGTASAVPAPPLEELPTTADPAAPWVTVDEAGATQTVTPCRNSDGPFKPFCLPKHHDVYFAGSTHYVTWDTTFFADQNTTLKVLGFYTNTSAPTTHPPTDHEAPDASQEEEEAFSSDTTSAAWGFYRWHLDGGALLSNPGFESANITLRIAALPSDGRAASWYDGPTISVQWKPRPPKEKPGHVPTRADDQVLYVALPLVFGFAAVMIAGTFCWNRQLRKIAIASAMGRSNTAGGSRRLNAASRVGVGASRKDRARNRDQEQGVRLMERGGGGSSDDEDGWRGGNAWGDDAASSGAAGRVFDRVDRKRM